MHCTFLPPHMLRALAESGDPEQRDRAHAALELSAQFRGERNATGPIAAFGEADFARFRELVLRSSGMELSEVRRSELERAVCRTVERAAMSGPSELYEHLSAAESTVDLEAFVLAA